MRREAIRREAIRRVPAPDRRRALPSVDRLLRESAATFPDTPRAVLTAAIRDVIAAARGNGAPAPADDGAWTALIATRLAQSATPSLRRVINATGVVVHTNLGRAPLADTAIAAIRDVAAGYSTREYDVESGTRGSRHDHCADLLRELTGAADAMVVNNAASALMLALAVAAEDGETIVSRGELIEIGGGFRIPEIMERSGTTLIEVGTTNRTRIGDYAKRSAVSGRRSAILKVHRSNFRVEGFTEEAQLAELVALGKKKKVPVLYDLGSGLMLDLGPFGLPGEPTLPAAAKSGATAVIASGDKLLGGPQAGILVGQKKFIAACRAHPLARAVRADKLTLAGLAATLHLYRDADEARRSVPVLRMLTTPLPELEQRARSVCDLLPSAARAQVVTTRSAVGGGSYPGVTLESRAVAIEPATLADRLRARPVPVIATVRKDRVLLDVRTLLPGDAAEIRDAVTSLTT